MAFKFKNVCRISSRAQFAMVITIIHECNRFYIFKIYGNAEIFNIDGSEFCLKFAWWKNQDILRSLNFWLPILEISCKASPCPTNTTAAVLHLNFVRTHGFWRHGTLLNFSVFSHEKGHKTVFYYVTVRLNGATVMFEDENSQSYWS